MKKTLVLIGLVLFSGGCSKTDLFGYSSFNHCMVKSMKHQHHKGMVKYAGDYCRELFPEKQGE